jgi:hypothetical protein
LAAQANLASRFRKLEDFYDFLVAIWIRINSTTVDRWGVYPLRNEANKKKNGSPVAASRC